MTEQEIRAIVREIVIEELREYFKYRRDFSLSEVDLIERLYQIAPRTAQLRREHRLQKLRVETE